MKKVLLIVLPLLVIAGIIVGLGFAGILKIPGLTKKKTKPVVVAASKDGTGGFTATAAAPLLALFRQADALAKAPPKPGAPPVTKPKGDSGAGNQKLASLWNEMSVDALVKITANWPEKDLAQILLKMDEEAVTKYLSTLDPKRAASISRALQTAASDAATDAKQAT